MPLRVGRLTIAAPLAELLAVFAIIVPSVILLATRNATVVAQMIEMQRLVLWTAPTAGFLACLLGGWWVARRASGGHERNGVALGVAVAILDLALLIVSGAPFGALMALSIVGRVAGGYCGGRLAKRAARHSQAATA